MAKLFRKRVAPGENLAFIGIMAGLSAVLSLVSALLPVSAVFAMLVLPLLSTMVAISCKKRYYPVYLLGAGAVCFIVTSFAPMHTVFYVFPALIIGIVFGAMIEAGLDSSYGIFAASLVQFILFEISLRIIEFAYEIGMNAVLLGLIGRELSHATSPICLLFGYAYSLAQVSLTYGVIETQFDRLAIAVKPMTHAYIKPIIATALGIVCLILAKPLPSASYLTLGLFAYWSFQSLILLKIDHYYEWMILGALTMTGVVLFPLFYGLIGGFGGLNALSIPVLILDIYALIWLFLFKKRQKDLE